jgi:hypothetical protein
MHTLGIQPRPSRHIALTPIWFAAWDRMNPTRGDAAGHTVYARPGEAWAP